MMWRDIPGWDRYEVSDTGVVRSKDMVVGARGGAQATRKGRVLAPAQKTNGYLAVSLTKENARTQECVHRLVALAFLGPPPYDGAHVLHYDGSRTNNSVHNLRWGTPADNHADTERHGKRRKREMHPRAKINEDAVRVIRSTKLSASILAQMYGISREHVWSVRRGRTWKG